MGESRFVARVRMIAPSSWRVRWLSVQTLRSQNSKTEDEALLRVSDIVVDCLAAMFFWL